MMSMSSGVPEKHNPVAIATIVIAIFAAAAFIFGNSEDFASFGKNHLNAPAPAKESFSESAGFFTFATDRHRIEIIPPSKRQFNPTGDLKIFDAGENVKINAFNLNCNKGSQKEMRAGISIVKGFCPSEGGDFGMNALVMKQFMGDGCNIAGWKDCKDTDTSSGKEGLDAEAGNFILPAESGAYCVTAGCGPREDFIDSELLPSSLGPKFTQIKVPITIVDFEDASQINLSSISEMGNIPCGRGRFCQNYGDECVWNNPTGRGLCAPASLSKKEERVEETVPAVADKTTPEIILLSAPATAWYDTDFSVKFSIREDVGKLNSDTIVATANLEQRCGSTQIVAKQPSLYNVEFKNCKTRSSDVGKDLKFKISASNTAGKKNSYETNVSIVGKPADTDTKPPRCVLSVGRGESNSVTPNDPATLRISCEDDYKTEGDLIGQLGSIEVFVVSGSLEESISKIGSQKPIGTNIFDGEFSCGRDCRQKVFGGDQQEQNFTYKVFVKDFAGHFEKFETEFRVKDVQPPTCSIYYNTEGDINSAPVKAGRGEKVIVHTKCFDNLSLKKIRFYADYVKQDGTEKESDGTPFSLQNNNPQQVIEFAVQIPADAKSNSKVIWYISAEDNDGNFANVPIYGSIIVKDFEPPRVEKIDSVRKIIFDGANFSVFLTASDNVELGLVKIQARKIGGNFEDVQSFNLIRKKVWNFPLEIPASWYSQKLSGQTEFEWKLYLSDKEGNTIQTDYSGTFNVKPSCAERKSISYLDLTSTNAAEYNPGDKISFSASFKNNYTEPNSDCGALVAAMLKLNATTSDGTLKLLSGTTPSGSLEAADFEITLPKPSAEENLMPGDIVSWKIKAWDASGNSIETDEKYFKVKDSESPIIRFEGLPEKVSSSQALKIKICVSDWNRASATSKIEALVGGSRLFSKDINLTTSSGTEDCDIVEYVTDSNLKENSELLFTLTAVDSAGNRALKNQKVRVMNPPQWTENRSPQKAKPNQNIVFSKYWKDDSPLKKAEFWMDFGSGLHKVQTFVFEKPITEGWVNFEQKMPKISEKNITWQMKVEDVFGNVGESDPEIGVGEDIAAPEILELGQSADEIYKSWSNFLRFKGRDDIELESATIYIKEPVDADFKFYASQNLNGLEASTAFEWKNENLIEGNIGWYLVVKDSNGNEVKTETKSFTVGLKEAPTGATPPTAPKITTSNIRKIVPRVESGKITQESGKESPPIDFGTLVLIIGGVVVLILILTYRRQIISSVSPRPWRVPHTNSE